MPNIASRGEKMNESIVIRATQKDKMELKLAATQQGTTVSTMIRQLLIANKMISPITPPKNEPEV